MVLFSCTPDKVGPSGNSTEQASLDQSSPHSKPVVRCSDIMESAFAKPGIGLFVDNCGGVPCGPSNQVAWGRGNIFDGMVDNTTPSMACELQVAGGWYISKVEYKRGNIADFSMSPEGIPTVDGTWQEVNIDPVLNATNIVEDLTGVSNDFHVAVRITIGQLDWLAFDGSLDASTITTLWLQNQGWKQDRPSPSPYLHPWTPDLCAPAATNWPTENCPATPSIPSVSCTQTVSNGGININSANDVVCVQGNCNIGSVNFNGPGTLVIDDGATVNGGINANNGGRVIVKGTFNWIASANINGNFKLYVDENGTLNRNGDLTMNNSNNLLVNLGTVNLNNNLTYVGTVHNAGALNAQGLNVNNNSTFINEGAAKFTSFANLNASTVSSNCGLLDVGNNLQINSNAKVDNYCTIMAHGNAHQNGTLDNYATILAGESGNGDGWNNQGKTILHDNSVLVTKNFLWSTNHALEVDGSAMVYAGSSTVNSDGELASFGTTGTLRLFQGVQLDGNGSLTVVDFAPGSNGDLPANAFSGFPNSLNQLVQVGNDATLEFRAGTASEEIPAFCY